MTTTSVRNIVFGNTDFRKSSGWYSKLVTDISIGNATRRELDNGFFRIAKNGEMMTDIFFSDDIGSDLDLMVERDYIANESDMVFSTKSYFGEVISEKQVEETSTIYSTLFREMVIGYILECMNEMGYTMNTYCVSIVEYDNRLGFYTIRISPDSVCE